MMKLAFTLLFLLSHQAFAEGDILAPKFGKKLKKMGISLSYEEESVDKLSKLVDTKLNDLNDTLTLEDLSKDDIEQIEEDVKFINFANNKFKSAIMSNSQKELYDSYNLLMRVMYAIAARPLEDRKIKIKEALKLLKRIRIKIPLIKDLDEPIGLKQAKLESRNLINPVDSSKYMTTEDLAKLTVIEIADLDISDDHTFWLSKIEHSNRTDDAWNRIENWMQGKVQEALDKKASGYSYDMHAAKKVLFFRKIKDSGTSPKVSAVDAFKAKWKVKWGIEIQTEPVVNDLYLKVGGRYEDLTYNMKTTDYILVLRGDGEDNCKNIRSVKVFKKCLKKSLYKFKVDHYVYKSGEITKENVDVILKDLPQNPTRKYQKDKLIGREYVSFKESLLEYKGGDFLNGGGVSSFNQFGSELDRVRRGLVVFNHFIWNSDAKDENNKLIMAQDFDSQVEYLLETQSDLGVSLASPMPGSNLNGMKTGNSFVNKKSKNIVFNQWVLYEPKPWQQATYADSLWMAKKIVQLTREDIRLATERIQWPQFMKDLLLYRLVGRRNKLAEVFSIEDLLPSEPIIERPTVRYSLKTREDREKASADLGLSVRIIEAQMEEYDLFKRDGTTSRHVDTLVYKGKLKPCRTTVLFGLLEKNHYPTGLTRRVNRFTKFSKLKDCPYIPRRRTGRR